MTAPSRSGVDFPVQRQTEAAHASEPRATLTGHALDGLVTDPVPSVTPRESGYPPGSAPALTLRQRLRLRGARKIGY